MYPPSRLVTGKFKGPSQRIPDRHVDSGFGGRVADGARQPRTGDLAFGQRQPDESGCEQLFNHRDYSGLGLAVGERPRRRLCHPDHSVIGMHTHQHVVSGVDLTRGELQRL